MKERERERWKDKWAANFQQVNYVIAEPEMDGFNSAEKKRAPNKRVWVCTCAWVCVRGRVCKGERERVCV